MSRFYQNVVSNWKTEIERNALEFKTILNGGRGEGSSAYWYNDIAAYSGENKPYHPETVIWLKAVESLRRE